MKHKSLTYLLISPDFPPPFVGGSCVYIYNLTQSFPGKLEILTACAPRHEPLPNQRHRVMRTPFLIGSSVDPPRWRLFVMYLFFMGFVLFTHRRYELVIAHTGALGNSLLILLLKMLRRKVVGIAHGEEISIPLKSRGSKHAIKGFFLKAAYRKADGFTANSEFTREMLAGLGIPRSRIALIPVMLASLKQEAAPAWDKEERWQNKKMVFSCGRLVKRKGFHLLMDAVRLLRPEMPDIFLVIAGAGPEHDFLSQKIKDCGLEEHVSLLGCVSDGRLAGLYSSCGLFVYANIILENGDCEGSSTVAVEAGAQGKPVIVGIEGGSASTVEHEVTGYHVDVRNVPELAAAMEKILSDPLLAARMGEAARRRAAAFHDPEKNGKLFHQFIFKISEGSFYEAEQPDGSAEDERIFARKI